MSNLVFKWKDGPHHGVFSITDGHRTMHSHMAHYPPDIVDAIRRGGFTIEEVYPVINEEYGLYMHVMYCKIFCDCSTRPHVLHIGEFNE